MAADHRPNECSCSRRKKGKAKPKPGKRKRQTMVYNPDEEVWHEPYMRCLRKEFSQISIPCDSKIELPWKDIALPAIAMKIRANVRKDTAGDESTLEQDDAEQGVSLEQKESTGKMNLPWNDLLVMDTVVTQPTLGSNGALCDSTLEIPWDDLALDKPIQIKPIPEEEPCDDEDVEIPWDDILVPANIVIETKKKRKHPSSKAGPNSSTSSFCCGKPACRITAGRK